MVRIFMLVAALALVAAACGTATDDDGDHSSETAAAAASTTTAAPTTTVAVTTTVAASTESTGGDQAESDESSDTTNGTTANTTTTNADRVVEIVMTDFAFDADPLDVGPGETIEFVVVNAGVVLHEFRLSNAHRIEEHLNDGHDDHAENSDTAEVDGHHDNGDVVLSLEAGETGSMVVTFPDDLDTFTEVACLIPGHYEAGMHSGIAYSA